MKSKTYAAHYIFLVAGIIGAAALYIVDTNSQHEENGRTAEFDIRYASERLVESMLSAAQAVSRYEGMAYYAAEEVAEELTHGTYARIESVSESDRAAFVQRKRSDGFAFYELMEKSGADSQDPVPLRSVRDAYAVLDFSKPGKGRVYVKGLDLLTVPPFDEALKTAAQGPIWIPALPVTAEVSGATVIVPSPGSSARLAFFITSETLFREIPHLRTAAVDGKVIADLEPNEGGDTTLRPWHVHLRSSRLITGTLPGAFRGNELTLHWEYISRADMPGSLIPPIAVLAASLMLFLLSHRNTIVMNRYKAQVHQLLFLRSIAVPSVVRRHNEEQTKGCGD